MEGARVHILTDEQLEAFAERVATATIEKTLARMLPPFSQHMLPDGVSARTFLTACRAGCPHTKKGRTLLVERSAWAAWTAKRPMTAPRKVTAGAHPRPANDLDLDALLDKAAPRR